MVRLPGWEFWFDMKNLEGSDEGLNFSHLEDLKNVLCFLVEDQVVDGWFEMTKKVEEVKPNLDSREFWSRRIIGFLNGERVI